MYRVRAITEADIPGFWDALDAVARESAFLRSNQAPPVEAVTKFVLSNIETGNPQMVAVTDDRVVGWCDIVRATGTHERHVGELGMGVVPEWRGRGVGKALLAETIAAADRLDLLRIELSVHSDNPKATALYRKFGFLEEGRKVRARLKSGVPVDVILMARLVPDELWPPGPRP